MFKNSKTKTLKTKTSKTKTHKNIEQRSNLKDPISSQRNKRERLYLLKKQTGRKNRHGPEDGHFIEKSSKTNSGPQKSRTKTKLNSPGFISKKQT